MKDKPSVTVSRSGVSSVKAADIIRSRAGQEELRKTRDAKLYTAKAPRSDASPSATAMRKK